MYSWSSTSPAAKTPGNEVRPDRPSTLMNPFSSMATWSLTRSVRGSWPMATNRPLVSSSDSSPVTVSRSRTPVTAFSPRTSTTSVFQRNRILGSSNARRCMILLARSSSRRWTRVTVRANRVRKVASSTAESPPPTTRMSFSLKKKPSQVAHQLTPRPDKRSSLGTPIFRYALPVARMTVRARTVSPEPVTSSLTSVSRRIVTMSSLTSSAPKRSAWARSWSIRSGPITPVGKPG